jgi:hypothetical protein
MTAPLPLASQPAVSRRSVHHHNPAVRKAVAARTAGGPSAVAFSGGGGIGAAQVPIVRAQIRLPNEQLSEKMLAGDGGGSRPATPVLGRKMELAASTPPATSKAGPDRRVPKSVASMVRR